MRRRQRVGGCIRLDLLLLLLELGQLVLLLLNEAQDLLLLLVNQLLLLLVTPLRRLALPFELQRSRRPVAHSRVGELLLRAGERSSSRIEPAMRMARRLLLPPVVPPPLLLRHCVLYCVCVVGVRTMAARTYHFVATPKKTAAEFLTRLRKRVQNSAAVFVKNWMPTIFRTIFVPQLTTLPPLSTPPLL